MKIKQHKESGLWVREDGAVLMPPANHSKFKKFRWTFGSKDRYGYMVVHFRYKHYKVHRLIAETFIPNPNGYPTVDHYPDRNPSNNAVSNLRWADYKLQRENQQNVDDCIERYGVRVCEVGMKAYDRARYANPEFAEQKRAKSRAYRAKHAERDRARCHEYEAKQRALGKRRRTCPDGVRRWLTDEEFDARYKKSSLMAGNSV